MIHDGHEYTPERCRENAEKVLAVGNDRIAIQWMELAEMAEREDPREVLARAAGVKL